MTRQEAAKEIVKLFADARQYGVYDDQEGTYAEAVALAVGALLKDGDNT
jgi:hypothetical protein